MTYRDFLSPSKEYRPAPLFCWNARLDPKEVAAQIKRLHDQGFGGYFMHSRIGLESPYLGEEWMAAITTGIKAANQYDMEAWFYDEDKWPSGFAGGLVPALGDAYRMKGLDSVLLDAESAAKEWHTPDDGLLPEGPRAVYAVEVDADGSLASYNRLTGPPHPNAPGQYLLCQARYFPQGHEWYNCESYVDLMDPDVTRAFLNSTYDEYAKRFGNDFGAHVPGIFTDEPNVLPRLFGPRPVHLSPWTPSFPEAFQAAYGYDLFDRLPLLFLQGSGSEQVRHDYWALVTLLFRDHFTKVLAEWCDDHGLILTGHYQSEDDLVLQTLHAGAIMPHYPYYEVPGIDHLGRNIDHPLTHKQVSSVAHQMGRTRVLSEIFGVSGHSMTFADQKWIADFHFALGVNFINQHMVLYSVRGERKRDYPANISWCQPYWDQYRLFNDYAARCSWFTQRGRFQTDILLMHPIASAWRLVPGRCFGLDQGPQLAKAYDLNRDFSSVLAGLLADHRDFDLGDELVMRDYARVEGDALYINKMKYKFVVLPYMTVLDSHTHQLLRQFIENGGRVYAVGPVPESPTDGPLTGMRQLPDVKALLATLSDEAARDISIEHADGEPAGHVLYHHRVDGERHLYFLAHTDAKESAKLRVRVPVAGTVTVFDLTSGQVKTVAPGTSTPFQYAAVSVVHSDERGVELDWDAGPAGSLAFAIGPAADVAETDDGTSQRKPSRPISKIDSASESEWIVDSGPWPFTRMHPNVMVLDSCRYALGGNPLSDERKPVPAVRAEVMEACGRKASTQPYMYLTGRQPSRSVPVLLAFTFFIEEMPKSLALVLEQPRRIEAGVNGTRATLPALDADGTDVAHKWLGDPGFGALDIRSLCRVGANTITLSFTAAADGADVEEIFLLGDFGVWKRDAGYVLGEEPSVLAPGSWVDQGYPFYCGTMRYRMEVDGTGGPLWLDLSDAAGSLLGVNVNGSQATTLPWRPWVTDIGPFLRPGPNAVDVDVISTLRNAFGPLHHEQGDITFTNPGNFMVGSHWTDTYQWVPYGLLGPVRLSSGSRHE